MAATQDYVGWNVTGTSIYGTTRKLRSVFHCEALIW